MKQYLALMSEIMNHGILSTNRTGVPDKALFGRNYKVVMSQGEDGVINGFPLLTTKKISLKDIFIELMWKLSGSTNIQPLLKQKVRIWTQWPFKEWLKVSEKYKLVKQFTDDTQQVLTDEWMEAIRYYEDQIVEDDAFAEKYGNLGITYGHNFRHFGEVKKDGVVIVPGKDQVAEALDRIRNKPDDRRIIISLWDPQNESKTLLPPCPCFYQFNARNPETLDLDLYQRSCDYFLGVPYNTAQDSLMLCFFAHVTKRKPIEFLHTFGDVHLYHNHLDVAAAQLTREPKNLPSLRIKKDTDDLFSIRWEDIELLNYDPYPKLKGQVAV